MRHCGHKTVANCPLQNNDGGYVNKGIGEVLGPPNTVFWRPAWCGRTLRGNRRSLTIAGTGGLLRGHGPREAASPKVDELAIEEIV